MVRWWAGETGPGVILGLVIIYIKNLNLKTKNHHHLQVICLELRGPGSLSIGASNAGPTVGTSRDQHQVIVVTLSFVHGGNGNTMVWCHHNGGHENK